MSAAFQRLPFTLPDFTRTDWVSEQARANWHPRIERITNRWRDLEWLAAAEGIRACALVVLPEAALEQFAGRVTAAGLSMAPLDSIAGSGRAYVSAASQPAPGQPVFPRVVVGRAEEIGPLREAWARNDQSEIGRLLGYPACCTQFFQKAWVEDRYRDTTWPMAVNTNDGKHCGPASREVAGLPYANILLRWLGVRGVPHLPCSFSCEASQRLGERFFDLALRLGFEPEARDLREMLEWPAEWSVLHGIATIKTPVLTIVASSDATAEKHVVRRMGSRYPADGAHGLGFPYDRRTSQPLRLMEA